MIKLTEVTEEVVTTNNEYKPLAPLLEKRCKEIISAATYIDQIKSQKNYGYEQFEKDCEDKILTETNVLANVCHDYIVQQGHSKVCYEFTRELVQVTVQKEESGYRFIFGTLFPPRGNIINKSILKGYSRRIDFGYKKALEEAIKSVIGINHKIYDERVVMEITYYFADESSIRDYDNFESKPIIDIISFHFIRDDSPLYVTTVYRYEKAIDNDHAEILILPERDYIKKRTNPNTL